MVVVGKQETSEGRTKEEENYFLVSTNERQNSHEQKKRTEYRVILYRKYVFPMTVLYYMCIEKLNVYV